MSAPTTFSIGAHLDFAQWGSAIVTKNGIFQLRRGTLSGRYVNRLYPNVEAWVDSFKSTAAAAGSKVTERIKRETTPLMKRKFTVPPNATDAEIALKFQKMYGSWTDVKRYPSLKEELASKKILRLQLELDGKQHSTEEIERHELNIKQIQLIYDATPAASRTETRYAVDCAQPRVFVQMGNGRMENFAVHKDRGMIVVGRNTIGRSTFAELGVPLTGTLKTSGGEAVRAIPEFWVLRMHRLTRIDDITVGDPAPVRAPLPETNLYRWAQYFLENIPAGAVQKTQEQLALQYAGQVIDKNGCLPCGKQVRWTREWDNTTHYLQDRQAV